MILGLDDDQTSVAVAAPEQRLLRWVEPAGRAQTDPDHLRRLRQEIGCGVYDWSAKLDLAMDRLIAGYMGPTLGPP